MSRYLKQARDALSKDFVPNNLGPKHINREELLNHNSFISKSQFVQQMAIFLIFMGSLKLPKMMQQFYQRYKKQMKI